VSFSEVLKSGDGTAAKQSAGSTKSNKDWWPNQLQLNILRQHADFSNPMGETLIMQQNLKV
jgi:catalase-peroxidase